MKGPGNCDETSLGREQIVISIHPEISDRTKSSPYRYFQVWGWWSIIGGPTKDVAGFEGEESPNKQPEYHPNKAGNEGANNHNAT